MGFEKRRFSRVHFQVRAVLNVAEESFEAAKMDNLSIGGCLFPITASLAEGTICTVDIHLAGASSAVSVHVDGEIVRAQPGAIAVRFTGIDPDSLFHLRNIIRYNAGDPDRVEEEIKHHAGIL